MLDAVRDIAAEAGRIIRAVREAGTIRADTKADRSLVTRADHEADAFLRRELLTLRPAGWLSEETADSPERLGAPALWVVDPLDGTKEFIAGLPEYVVAIGFVEAGETVLGLVHNPATGETFGAERGSGAFVLGEGKEGEEGEEGEEREEGGRLRVVEGNTMLVSRTEIAEGEFEPFGDEWTLRATGSIQYKLALIARGKAALTLSRGPKHEWDVCAGALLVREAGGVATDLFGGPLRYNQAFPKVRGILAGAPRASARAAAVITRVGGSPRMREFDNVPKGV